MDLLVPSGLHTTCAYKGHASYWSVRVGERLVLDLAWTYEEPLHDAEPVRGLVSLFTERARRRSRRSRTAPAAHAMV